MRIKVVTCTNADGYEITKKFLKDLDTNFNGDFDVEVCYHGFESDPEFDVRNRKLFTRNLDDDEDFVTFYTSSHPRNVPNSPWHDCIKWSPKIFAVCKASREGYDFLVWLDNDIDIYSKITPRDLRLKGDFTYCYREAVAQLEGCFMGFDLRSLHCNLFIDAVLQEYISGRVWSRDMLTDQFIFSRMAEEMGVQRNNLTPNVHGLEAFNQSPLYPKMYHKKGNKKLLPYRNRYEQLSHLVDRYKPKTIVEVGTGPGSTAMLMLQAALQHQRQVSFYGFGLFEDETEQQQIEGYTTKKNKTLAQVKHQIRSAFGDRVRVHLFKGDSRKTMPGNVPKRVDFAYIDGGHHLDIVKSDYENTKHAKVIVFDDYWTDYKFEDDPPPENRMAPFFDLLGCEVLPSHDPCISILKPELREPSHITHLAVKLNEGVPLPTNWVINKHRPNVVVNPVDCVPKDNLKGNIVANLNKIDRWFEPFAIHGGTAILVSGGLELPKHLDEIKTLQREGGEVFCVKHALPILRDAGITPEYCVVLDPRELNEESTHGVIRKDLFEGASKDTIFLVASMTNPAVVDHLLNSDLQVMGWHARTSSVVELGIQGPQIPGGSCSAARAIIFAINFGFRKMHLFGYDFYVPKPTEEEINDTIEEGRRKYLPYTSPKGRSIWTTGELIAAIQDMQNLFSQVRDVKFVVHGENVTKDWYETLVQHTSKEYEGKNALLKSSNS